MNVNKKVKSQGSQIAELSSLVLGPTRNQQSAGLTVTYVALSLARVARERNYSLTTEKEDTNNFILYAYRRMLRIIVSSCGIGARRESGRFKRSGSLHGKP